VRIQQSASQPTPGIIHNYVQRANQKLSQQPLQGYYTEAMDTEEQPTKSIRPAAAGSEQIRPQSVVTTPRQTRAMTRQELPCTSAANNRLANTNRKRTHQDSDEHDASQSRQIQGNANKTGRSESLHQCSQRQPDDVNVLQHAPRHQSLGSSQRQTRSMTQRYETQDANAEDCHIKNACKKHPYSAGTPPESPSATQDSEIQNTTQRKSQWLAERQQTLAPQANEQPPKPKGTKRKWTKRQ
jgi:hypothetical protein